MTYTSCTIFGHLQLSKVDMIGLGDYNYFPFSHIDLIINSY